MTTKSPIEVSPPTNYRLLLVVLIASTVIAIAVVFLGSVPQKIIDGEKGQQAIKVLDEMRHPLLAIKAADIGLEERNTDLGRKELSSAVEAADVLIEDYFEIAQYNRALLQSVTLFKNEYEKWAHRLQHYHLSQKVDHSHPELSSNKADHYLEASRSFLNVMSLLADGEVPIHKDIDEGRSATRLAAFLLSAIILAQIITFVSQTIRRNSRLNYAQKELEKEITAKAKTQAQIDLLVEKTPGVIYSCKYAGENNFIPTYCTPNIKNMMGYSPEEFYNQEKLWSSNIHPEDAQTVFKNYEKLFQDDKSLQRYRWKHKNGGYVWVRDEISLVRDESGEPAQIVGVWVNIDEQKAIEEDLEEHQKRLEESVDKLTLKNLEIGKVLDEKDILFKELHHRVKNNMQVISALLSMQSMKSDNDEVVDELLKGKDRIDSMALVHELLYQTDDMARVDLVKYINELGETLLGSHQGAVEGITISVEGETCLLLADTIVPLGLILNELFINSFKHGLKSSKGGRINVSCSKSKEGSLVIRYSDNGKGIPEDELAGSSNSLGVNLIKNLSKQLDADIKFFNDDGMHFDLVAPIQ